MSLHGDLLQQAKGLAEREPRRPKQATLRRAVSTAYYALFHLFIAEATARLVTGAGRIGLRRCLGRAFGHSAMKDVAQGFAVGKVSPKIKPALGGRPIQPELIAVAEAFVDLQQARHEADYDTAVRFTREECRNLVLLAERAFRDWQSVRRTVQADVCLVAMLAQKQMQI